MKIKKERKKANKRLRAAQRFLVFIIFNFLIFSSWDWETGALVAETGAYININQSVLFLTSPDEMKEERTKERTNERTKENSSGNTHG